MQYLKTDSDTVFRATGSFQNELIYKDTLIREVCEKSEFA